MKARQLEKLGIPSNLAKLAKWSAAAARKDGADNAHIRLHLSRIVADPDQYTADPHFGELATALSRRQQQRDNVDAARRAGGVERAEPAPWRAWGDGLDPKSVQQMENACRLPVSLRGALMPDAHVGYGLPIGGVLATNNAVIPYAVGVDIACRVKLSILDLPVQTLQSHQDRLIRAIEEETRFGVGAEFGRGRTGRRDHPVMDEDWNVTPITRQLKDKAHAQLGTSGSGNHFVEFGEFHVDEDGAKVLNIPAGTHLALLSHSGSRGAGASIASHYSRLARDLHPELPPELTHLAWLDLDTQEGHEYWHAMQLMGKYASANHALIHKHIVKHLGARVLCDVENHHNFAWKERHVIDGEPREVIVHRKGATPAGLNVLGFIPGSMASPGYLVRGKGSEASLQSAAHGAGRVMSRTLARNTYRWNAVRPMLEQRGVRVLSAGIDEVPFVYKNIDQVMAAQSDLVETLGRFDPRLVKMAPEGEKAED